MIHTTYIVRSSDGLILAENLEDSSQKLFDSKNKVKKLIKSGLSKKINSDVATLEVGEHHLSIKLIEGIGYMVLTDKKYPLKLAHCYLDEICQGFLEELKNHYGTHQSLDLRSKIDTLEEPYYFMKSGKFDRFLKKKKQEYQDTRSDINTDRLKNDINNLHDVVKENIELLLDREQNITKMSHQASELKDKSKIFKDQTKNLMWSLWFKKNMLYIAIVAIIVLFLYIKFF